MQKKTKNPPLFKTQKYKTIIKMCWIQADIDAYLLDVACCIYPKFVQMSQQSRTNSTFESLSIEVQNLTPVEVW